MYDDYQLFQDYEVMTVATVVAALGLAVFGKPLAATGVIIGFVTGLVEYVQCGAYRSILDARFPSTTGSAYDEEEPLHRAVA